MIHVVIYDQEMKKKAYLENAFNIGYEKKLNELWTASFSLPATDPKNTECEPFRYVEIFDSDGERVELFRILPTTLSKQDTTTITYRCEHVLATLIDDVMFQYHEIGGVGVYTQEVLEYILSHQSTQKWQLGNIEFSRQFLYKWENENLLGSLFSVPKPFLESYIWTWDTTSFPWTLNLVEIAGDVKSYIRYKKNLRGIEKYEDPTQLCTRLYCLGYGEGVNQLTISDVNNGKPYLDAPTINRYGIVSRIFVDRRFEDAESLKATGQAMLRELQVPRLEYEVDAADLHSITNDPVDKFQVGTYTRVIDTELDMNVKALVVGLSKSDITGNPGDIKIYIANKPQDIASSISELANRQRINEVYAQGATNLDSYNFMDNCDPNYPAVLKFYIPEETVRINKLLLTYETAAFRGYSRATEGGGAIVDTTGAGGGEVVTSKDGGDHRHMMFKYEGGTWDDGRFIETTEGGGHTHSVRDGGGHGHRLYDHNHVDSAGGATSYNSSGIGYGGDHAHDIYPHTGHTHRYNYPLESMQALKSSSDSSYWNVGLAVPIGHREDIWTWGSSGEHSHELDLPKHSHRIDLPNHTHDIEYGIYEGPTPAALTIEVDGNKIIGLGINESDINIIPYLSKDGGGKINRGWHEIKITPDNLGRIVASVVMQMFVQSRGGGDY